MKLTSAEITLFRVRLLTLLDNGETVEIDSRFIKPFFNTREQFLAWCQRWNIDHESYIRPGMFRTDGTPIEWTGMHNRTADRPVIFIPTDDSTL